jgi:hypothetical protein
MLGWVWVHFEEQSDTNIAFDRYYKSKKIIKQIFGSSS